MWFRTALPIILAMPARSIAEDRRNSRRVIVVAGPIPKKILPKNTIFAGGAALHCSLVRVIAGYPAESAMGKIRHIAIQVPDLEKAAAFYEGVFELTRVNKVDSPIGNAISLSDGVMNLTL